MAITVVNEWWFKKDADIKEARAAAFELVEYMRENEPSVLLSIWSEDCDEPRHNFHITVFEDYDSMMILRESDAIKRFIDKFWPHIIRDETYKSPFCGNWLTSVSGIKDEGI